MTDNSRQEYVYQSIEMVLGPPAAQYSLSAGPVERFHNAAPCSFQSHHFGGLFFLPNKQKHTHR
jgi:hypothetical protein